MEEISQHITTPLNYLKIFFRRKEIFIIPLYAGLILGICAGILLPKKYQSSTIILVEEGKTDNPLFTNLAVSTSVTQRMTAIQESMLGWNSLIKMVKRLNMDKDVKTPRDLEKLILGIRRNITIRLRAANIIDLSYVGDDPQLTQAVVKTITEIFIERNLETQSKETSDAITFIEAQLRVYKGKIKSAEIALLNDQLNALLVDSTESHPKVQELRSQVAKKKEELAKDNLEYTENIMLDEKSNNPIIEEIKKALDNMETTTVATSQAMTAPASADAGVYKVMLMDKLDNVMARDVDVNTSIYNKLLERLETAKMTQRLQLSKEGTRYTILDPPRVPLQPFQPNKVLVALMGIFLGGLLGVGLVLATEFFDKSFLDVQEAKEYLGVPLLGAISKINTVESVRQEKEQTRWFASVTVVAGLVVVVLTVVVAGLLK